MHIVRKSGFGIDDYHYILHFGCPRNWPFPAWSLSKLWQMVHELDRTYDFPSRLSAEELIESLVKTIIYRRTH